MNSGTAEQEQNGVTIPSSAASTLPTDSRLPARIARVRSGVKNERTTPTPKTTSVSSMSTLGTSKTKNSTALPRCVGGLELGRRPYGTIARARLQRAVDSDPEDQRPARQAAQRT